MKPRCMKRNYLKPDNCIELETETLPFPFLFSFPFSCEYFVAAVVSGGVNRCSGTTHVSMI